MCDRGTLFTISHDILIPGVNLNSHPLKWEVQIRPVLRSLRISLVVGNGRVQYPTYGRKGLVTVRAIFNWR
jgi:hypothetical protein